MDTKLKGDIAEQAVILSTSDFDFAILYIEELEVFYIMPSEVFNGYGSEIHLVESEKRQRKPRSAEYRERWGLLEVK